MQPSLGGLESFQIPALAAGSTYRLWCSLPEHVLFGMEATLRVSDPVAEPRPKKRRCKKRKRGRCKRAKR